MRSVALLWKVSAGQLSSLSLLRCATLRLALYAPARFRYYTTCVKCTLVSLGATRTLLTQWYWGAADELWRTNCVAVCACGVRPGSPRRLCGNWAKRTQPIIFLLGFSAARCATYPITSQSAKEEGPPLMGFALPPAALPPVGANKLPI